jgi:hypothetical protein
MNVPATNSVIGFQNLSNPESTSFDEIFRARPFVPFSPLVTDFLNQVSEKLMAHALLREFPDVATFAFWCRKASISKMNA